jgi:hypothetical protein
MDIYEMVLSFNNDVAVEHAKTEVGVHMFENQNAYHTAVQTREFVAKLEGATYRVKTSIGLYNVMGVYPSHHRTIDLKTNGDVSCIHKL